MLLEARCSSSANPTQPPSPSSHRPHLSPRLSRSRQAGTAKSRAYFQGLYCVRQEGEEAAEQGVGVDLAHTATLLILWPDVTPTTPFKICTEQNCRGCKATSLNEQGTESTTYHKNQNLACSWKMDKSNHTTRVSVAGTLHVVEVVAGNQAGNTTRCSSGRKHKFRGSAKMVENATKARRLPGY